MKAATMKRTTARTRTTSIFATAVSTATNNKNIFYFKCSGVIIMKDYE